MRHLHFLMAGRFEGAASLAHSNLASLRMRALPASVALLEAQHEVSWGEAVLGRPDRVFVTKIGGHDIPVRQPQWLRQIAEAKRRGASIWVDYTDHHLGFESVMSGFYTSVLALADVFTVPSSCMRQALSAYWQGPVHVVPDAIEVDAVAPKQNQGKPVTALWFGHASNMAYLRSFLENGLVGGRGLRLIVLSNPIGLRMLTERPVEAKVPLEILMGEWSLDTMREAAMQSDLCLIPSDTQDPRKMLVSANRLLTALALGLPTAADNLESYAEFGEYFTNIHSGEFARLLDQPARYAAAVEHAQKSIVPQFSLAAMTQAWARILA